VTHPRGREIRVLHRDEHIVVVNKPGGMLVHRTKESADTVFLLQEMRNQLGLHVFPVHRLDRAVSGAIAFALSSEDARELQASMSKENARKEYLALVRGSTPAEGESRRPLTADNGVKKEAHTSFEKIAELSRCSLLRVRIYTGRRHQIRRHLSHLAHQLIGDTSYGKGRINAFFREEYGLPRLFLHASRLEIDHPRTGKRLEIFSPLADDLRRFLKRLPDHDASLLETL
jgi:tRNA pseudouridine65 synthase